MIGEWVTPAGHPASLHYRDGTNDWNVINSVNLPGNEYDLPTGLTGWAIDIGAHLGSVSIALALDNPGVRVLAVEPLPSNVELIALNIAANALEHRITILEGAAGTEPLIWYGGSGDAAEHHANVGGNQWARAAADAQTITAHCYSLASLMAECETETVAFLKIDCEGCEWSFLDDPTIKQIAHIAGEWHPEGGGSLRRLKALLGRTHVVETIGDHGFRAVRR